MIAIDPQRSVVLDFLIRARRSAVWRCWTEAELLKAWYCPLPWRVEHAELDVRPGGRNFVLMKGPDGEEMAIPGVYLDVVPGSRLVFTDAFERAWRPSAKAFMVADISFEDAHEGDDSAEGGLSEAAHTRYLARIHHWSAADRAAHEAMGLREGWAAAALQLEMLAQSL